MHITNKTNILNYIKCNIIKEIELLMVHYQQQYAYTWKHVCSNAYKEFLT